MKTKQNVMMMAFFWLILLVPAKMFAQTDTSAAAKRERIKAQKVAFITQKLDLTPTESQNFWPVYNEYDAKKEALGKAYRQKVKEYKKSAQTEAQADTLITAQFKHEQELLDLKVTYYTKMRAVIPATKLAKLGEAEMGFKRMLLKLIKEPRKVGLQRGK